MVERFDDDLEAVGAVEERVVDGVKTSVTQVDQSLRLRPLRVLEVIQVLLGPVQNKVQVFPLFRLFVHFFVQEIEIASDDYLVVLLAYKVGLHFRDGFVDFDVLL